MFHFFGSPFVGQLAFLCSVPQPFSTWTGTQIPPVLSNSQEPPLLFQSNGYSTAIELQNDLGHCRRCSRTGSATPRRGAFQHLTGPRPLELERQFGEAAIYRAGSACGKTPCAILTIQSAWRWCFDTLLCRCDLSVAQEHLQSTPIPEPTSGSTQILTGILCMSSGLFAIPQAITLQRGTCLSRPRPIGPNSPLLRN